MKLYLFIVSSVVIIVLAENVIHDTYELYNSLPENGNFSTLFINWDIKMFKNWTQITPLQKK